MKPVAQITLVLLLGVRLAQAAPFQAAGPWIELFDGQTLTGWKAAENPQSFRVQDGMIVGHGERSHLFYVGEVESANFKNFELRAQVMVAPGGNSGIFFHTAFQEQGFPNQGYEAQVNNSYTGHGDYYEFKKTGSLYGIRNQYKSIGCDNQWLAMHLVVEGKRIRIAVNDTLLVDYTEPARPIRGQRRLGRVLSRGTFALQCHDAGSRVCFRDIRVRPLPDDDSQHSGSRQAPDRYDAQILRLSMENFPLVDFHVHLKGSLTLPQALANSRQVGIQYGIAPNCGLGFPITSDEGIHQFLETVKGQPVLAGMQAEGREWVKLFSKEAIEQFDYVFTDAMTFTDDQGKRVRLWIDEEVEINDENAFMEMYVDRILSVLNDEPIDIYVNPTFLPTCIAGKYDQLWTAERMDRVIDAAVRNNIAIEINARYRIPSATFIQRAKQAGVKFAFGTNNTDSQLGRLEYCLDMIETCGLTGRDMFMPKPRQTLPTSTGHTP